MKEAVWFKNGKEISWVDPVEEVVYDEDITKIRVFNGNYWYDASDCNEVPDDFVVRERVDEEDQGEFKRVVHGHWVLLDNCSNHGVYCSVCNKKVYKDWYGNVKVTSNYCPNCGAVMDEEFKKL